MSDVTGRLYLTMKMACCLLEHYVMSSASKVWVKRPICSFLYPEYRWQQVLSKYWRIATRLHGITFLTTPVTGWFWHCRHYFILSSLSHHFFLYILGVEGYCCTWSLSLSLSLTHTHTQTRAHTQSVRILWTRNRPVAENSNWRHTTFTRDRQSCPRGYSNPQSQQISGCTPTP